MIIIPAIDILNGRCVRLKRGDFLQTTIYDQDPLDVAKTYQDAGFSRLHLVDLDGAKAGNVRNWKILEKIASRTNLVIDFSGGISRGMDLEIAFNSGAAFSCIGTMAVTNEKIVTGWLYTFGPDKFIISADVKEDKIATKGWTQTSEITASELISHYKTKGIAQFYCTDINKDGMLLGPSLEMYKKLRIEHPAEQIVASGGISTRDDLVRIKETGCYGAIIGKALFENKITFRDLKEYF